MNYLIIRNVSLQYESLSFNIAIIFYGLYSSIVRNIYEYYEILKQKSIRLFQSIVVHHFALRVWRLTFLGSGVQFYHGKAR